MGSLLLSPGSWCAQGSICALQESVSLVLCKFWWLSGELMVTSSKRAYATPKSAAPRAHPCGSPLLTRTSTGDSQTQFCLSLCGVPGFWYAQGLFEPSEHLWREWGLILDENSPFLPSCWAFFALARGLSPHSCSSAYHLTGFL